LKPERINIETFGGAYSKIPNQHDQANQSGLRMIKCYSFAFFTEVSYFLVHVLIWGRLMGTLLNENEILIG